MKEKDEKSNILVFAHRGASKEFPENTMPSFKRAAELGVDFIETDIHFTKDERFAVIHDDSIDRTTDGSGKVAGYTMHELKKFDAGYYFTKDNGKTYPYRGKGITLMSLEEMLDAFPGQRFNIDLKDKNPYQIRHFAEVIDKFNAYNRIIAVSEHYVNLNALRKMKPQIATSFSMREKLWLYFLYKSGFIFLNISFKSIFLQVPVPLSLFPLAISCLFWYIVYRKRSRFFPCFARDRI